MELTRLLLLAGQKLDGWIFCPLLDLCHSDLMISFIVMQGLRKGYITSLKCSKMFGLDGATAV